MAVWMAGGSSSLLLAGPQGASNVDNTGRTMKTTQLTMATTDNDDGVDWAQATVHTMGMRDLESVQDIYSEFKGLGVFKDMPIAGGLEECNQRWKTRWRRHFNATDQKRFSWMSMLTKAADQQVALEGRELDDVLSSFDAYFLQKKQSFCGLIALLQAEGLLQKKAPPTKKRVQGESPEEGGGGGQAFA
jgi:hypothetical protein